MNTTTNTTKTTATTTKERIMNALRQYTEAFNEKSNAFFIIYMLLLVVWLFPIIVTGSKATIHVLVFALSSVLALRMLFYFFKAEGVKNKLCLKKFFMATYTEDDLNEICCDIERQAKANIFAEISKQKAAAVEKKESDQISMRDYLRGFYAKNALAGNEERCLVEIALWLSKSEQDFSVETVVDFFKSSNKQFTSKIDEMIKASSSTLQGSNEVITEHNHETRLLLASLLFNKEYLKSFKKGVLRVINKTPVVDDRFEF